MDLAGSSEVGNEDMAAALDATLKAKSGNAKPAEDSKTVRPLPYPVEVDHGRDE